MIPSPFVMMGAIMFWVASVTGSYVWGYRASTNAHEAAASHDLTLAATAQEAAQQGAAAEIAKIEVKNTPIRQRVETATHESPSYRSCKHTPSVMRDIRAAFDGADSVDGGELPDARPAD